MYNMAAKVALARLHSRISPEVAEAVTQEMVRLGPEALRLLLTFPEPLVLPASRHWIVSIALRMKHEEAVPVLIEALSHPDWRICQIARDTFSKMGEEVTGELAGNLKRCTSPGGRIQTLCCLHRLADPFGPLAVGDKALIAPIADVAASDESPEVRAKAIEVLSRSEAHEAADTIVLALEDPSEDVRLCAANAAGRLRLTEAVPALVKMLEHDDAEVRSDLLYALDRIGDAKAAPAVRTLLDDEDWYVRWTAVKALEGLWQAENVEALKQAAARDEHPIVVIAAVETLARKAPEDSADAIAEAARSDHPGVRNTALFYAVG